MSAMPNIDFMFLAEFAKVEDNASITAVGAGFRGLTVVEGTREIRVYVGTRLTRSRNELPAMLSVTVDAPNDLYSIGQTTELQPVDSDHDWASTVVVTVLRVPVVGSGEYTVRVSVSDSTEPKSVPLWIAVIPAGEK